MDRQIESLNLLLRWELTAVHQQFIHILVLRAWGDTATAERITEVDDIDFPNAMQIIDYLVSSKAPISLPGDNFVPGHSHRTMLACEAAFEKRFAEIIEDGECRDEQPLQIFATAREPRAAYANWLKEQLDRLPPDDADRPDFAPEMAGFFGCLLTVIEQLLVHAFVHWHNGRNDLADAAWSTSGAAMMQATEHVHLFAASGSAPFPRDMPRCQIEYDSNNALKSDRDLVHRCAIEASEAAIACHNANLEDYCQRVAAISETMLELAPGTMHPAADDNPPAFRNFQGTLQKYL